MLNIVFIGRRGDFNLWLTRWLAHRSHLKGIIWADTDRAAWAWRWRWAKRQLKKNSLLQVADQMLCRFHWVRSKERKLGMARIRKELEQSDPGEPVDTWPPPERRPHYPTYRPETVDFIRSHRPDLLFLNCSSALIPRSVLEIPRLGTYILHEGVTPEYRGVHSPLWAVANGDFDKVGYTLLKANERFDAGDVYAQGTTTLDPLRTSLGYLIYASLLEGLDEIERVLREAEQGTARPIDVSGRPNGYYGYLPYSQMRRIFKRRRAAGIDKNVGSQAFPRRNDRAAAAAEGCAASSS